MKLTTPPSSAEIKNMWRYAFTPLNIFMAWYLIKQRDNFVFIFMMCVCFSDDDFSESTGYHCALPLEVHGAGYAQLQMISNTKAGKLVSVIVTNIFLQENSFYAVVCSLVLGAVHS
jgi:hypothetical protein